MRKIKVFDFFSGCGGTSQGLRDAGMEIIAGIDIDKDAGKTFKRNFTNSTFLEGSIVDDQIFEQVGSLLQEVKKGGEPILFTGCAPCQPFSQQNTTRRNDDERRTLLDYFANYIIEYTPDYIFIENVPGIQKKDNPKNKPFFNFLNTLETIDRDSNGTKCHYNYHFEVVKCLEYGIPQIRRRLVLIASKHEKIIFPEKTHGPDTNHPEYEKVKDWISKYPSLEHGQEYTEIPNHRAGKLSEKNLERLKKLTSPGDSRDKWGEEEQLDCHKEYKGHTDVYGRMHWDGPAKTLTTKCTSLSNGRYGHPFQHRAISVREAASLQTFPDSFIFEGSLQSMTRQVGNAVPPLLAQRFGEKIIQLHEEAKVKNNG